MYNVASIKLAYYFQLQKKLSIIKISRDFF